MTGSQAGGPQPALRPGRILVPGTARQLGTFGLFAPAPGQRRTVDVTGGPLEVKSAEGDLLWVGFRELTGAAAPARDFAALAGRFGEWVVDGLPSRAGAAGSPEWQRFLDVVDVLFAADVTLFVIGPALPEFGPDSPLSRLLRVDSDHELPAAHSSGS
ncbi:AFG1/ZapE family ATPase [Arthrobacter sp. SPG23]|uniref:AFG1/ZapE family ATPase n=1 Tax=Arthrobacter sp. SPG23 TaxID=1610703 RepID=UPI0006990A11|nr:AFG1/ZapE family ATPase [Arthrobacter sp. SPG23]